MNRSFTRAVSALLCLTLLSCSTKEPLSVPVSSISLDVIEKALNANESFTLVATVLPDNADDKSVKFSSSDVAVATVGETSGVVKAVAKGQAVIVARTADNAHSAKCRITVKGGSEPGPTVYSISTGDPSDITPIAATISGKVTSSSGVQVTGVDVGFFLSDNASLSNPVDYPVASLAEDGTYELRLLNLRTSKEHYYCSYMMQNGVRLLGEIKAFTTGKATIFGKVTDTGGNGLGGVVVSDGAVCAKTESNGAYALQSSLTGVDYIMVSTPSGYSAPVSDGIPVFFKKFNSLSPSGGIYSNVNFSLEKLANPEHFSILISADPQPRLETSKFDKIAFHCSDCVKDMCKDFKETGASLASTRKVYGLMLGDVCHNEASLFSGFKDQMKANGFPTYYVIGNYDYDLDIQGDKASAATFEKYFGPTNYSFNLGNIHFVVLDNMIVADDRTTNSNEDLASGLRDDIWKWLDNDLAMVSDDTPLMICSHAPMFMAIGQTMVTRNNVDLKGRTVNTHYRDLDKAVERFSKVQAWAGHTHVGYNYAPAGSKVETHTITRVLGELWTNEFVADGTPRGYVIFNYDEGRVSWKYHPIKYQTATYLKTSGPAYKFRDWTYNSSGIAKMKVGGKTLDDTYQMHLYAPGSYSEDTGKSTVYANIFMWDEQWDTPVLNCNGKEYQMTRAAADKNYRFYDMSSYEMTSWYKANDATLKDRGSYKAEKNGSTAVFFVSGITSKAAGSNSGTVTVKDRFGNTYSSTISW